jgi:hypothetical protein
MSVYTLVTLILAAVTLILLLGITTVFNATASDNVNMCAGSVAVRAGIVQSNTPGDAPIEGCVSERKTLSGDTDSVRKQLAAKYSRCKLMFGPAANQALTRDSATYCHVCGLYTISDHQQIQGVFDTISSENEDASIFEAIFSDTYSSAPQELDTSGLVSVLFIQDKTVDYSLWSWLIQPVVDRVSVFGGVISSPESQTISGIVITPYTQEVITQLGCTTIDPSQQ